MVGAGLWDASRLKRARLLADDSKDASDSRSSSLMSADMRFRPLRMPGIAMFSTQRYPRAYAEEVGGLGGWHFGLVKASVVSACGRSLLT